MIITSISVAISITVRCEQLKVGDVFGKVLSGTTCSLQSVKSIMNSAEELNREGDVFTWNVPSTVKAGVYKAKLKISADSSKAKATHVFFKIVGKSSFESVSLFVSKQSSGSDVASSDRQS